MLQDHIAEVMSKWHSIDDEIWAKVIVLERNRRVAKAYARAPVLTVNGSDDGFDGFRIGLSGFENPMRDAKTEEVKRHIGQVSSALLLCSSEARDSRNLGRMDGRGEFLRLIGRSVTQQCAPVCQLSIEEGGQDGLLIMDRFLRRSGVLPVSP